MSESNYKKYTIQARRGIKGEAFFEALVSEYCIPHRITGPKDIGIDYICEWVYGDRPSGILFAVQVKTFSKESVTLRSKNNDKGLNGLSICEIRNSHLKINQETRDYWSGLGLPFYLFVIVEPSTCDGTPMLDCYYKRFTDTLTSNDPVDENTFFYQKFYHANQGSSFFAFSNTEKKVGGFARDLFIDYVRCCYHKGIIITLDPKTIGLEQFPSRAVFVDLFKSYSNQICSAYKITKFFLNEIGYDTNKSDHAFAAEGMK